MLDGKSTKGLSDASHRIYDISPLITEKIAVFPEDTPYERRVSLSFESGDNLALSAITTTLHLGSHADAPVHYHPRGAGIAERPPAYYLGPCQVIDVVGVRNPDGRLRWQEVQGQLVDPALYPRVLFKTNSFPDPNTWTHNFMALSPELISQLAQAGVKLIGIDTPSIDPGPAKELTSHAAVYAFDLAILEGLVLQDVPAGVYELIALPLRLAGADASPVRAILREWTAQQGHANAP